MKRILALILALFLALPVAPAYADDKKPVHVKEYVKKDGTHVAAHDRKAPEKKTEQAPAATRSGTVARDSHGKIERSEKARHDFEKQTGYPHGRPGYIIDHIIALACGGADAPSNMQWQSAAEAKAKDKVERKGCY